MCSSTTTATCSPAGCTVTELCLPGTAQTLGLLAAQTFAEQLDLTVEVGGGVEVLVHAGESQVGDLVDRSELGEDEQADLRTGGLGPGEAHRVLDGLGDLLDLPGGDPPALRRRLEPLDDLAPIERLDRAVRLDDRERHLVNAFERGEPVAA